MEWCVIRGLFFSLSNPIQSTAIQPSDYISPQYIYNRIPRTTQHHWQRRRRLTNEKMTWYATKLLGKARQAKFLNILGAMLLPISPFKWMWRPIKGINAVDELHRAQLPAVKSINRPTAMISKQLIDTRVYTCVCAMWRRLLLLSSWGTSSTTPKYIFVSRAVGSILDNAQFQLVSSATALIEFCVLACLPAEQILTKDTCYSHRSCG